MLGSRGVVSLLLGVFAYAADAASGTSNASLLEVDSTDLSIVTIKDLGNLFKGRSFGLDIEEVHEDKFECDPALNIVSTCSLQHSIW